MNGFMKITAPGLLTSCLLLGGGCRATETLTNWTSKSEADNAAVTESLLGRIEQKHPDVAANVNQTQPALSIDELTRRGQSEIAAWYRDRSAHHLAAAKGHFEAVLIRDRQNSRAHHGLAIIADLERDFETAERHYQQALVQNPNDSDILGDMGYSYLLQDRLSESEQYSLRAIEARPTNQKAIKHLADAYARQGKTELAEQTYARILPPEQVKLALQENSPKAGTFDSIEVKDQSVFDRLIPGKSRGEKLAEDIRRRQQAFEEQMRQHLPPKPEYSFPVASSPMQRPRLPEGELLKQQLAAIDNEGSRRYDDGPIMIDDQTGQMTRLPGADQTPSQYSQGAPSNAFPSSTIVQTSNQSMPEAQGQPNFSNGPVRAVNSYNSQFSNPQRTGNLNPASNGETTYQGQRPQFSHATRPWEGIQQTAGTEQNEQVHYAHQQRHAGQSEQMVTANGQLNSMTAPQGFQGVSHTGPQQPYANASMNSASANAPAQQRPFNGTGGPAPGPSSNRGQYGTNGYNPSTNGHNPNGYGPAGGAPSQTMQTPVVPNGTPGMPQQDGPASDPYQSASQAAARMGMGLGPGSMFPVFNQFNQSVSVSPPGSMNYDNSRPPEPPRYMPDRLPPQDLNQVFQPFPNSPAPPASSQGVAMPPTTTPSYSYEQYGTASRYDPKTLQSYHVPPSYNEAMQDYETQRWIAGKELNHAVEQVWNQGPINSPLSPSAGSIYTHPDASGPMYTPNAPVGPGQTHAANQMVNSNNALPPPAWPHRPQNSNSYAGEYQLRQQQAQQQQMQTPGQQQLGTPGSDPQLSVPLGNDQYGNNQYNIGQSTSPSTPQMSRQPSRRRDLQNVVTPPAYQNYSQAQSHPSNSAPSGNQVTPASATEEVAWPTIRPATR